MIDDWTAIVTLCWWVLRRSLFFYSPQHYRAAKLWPPEMVADLFTSTVYYNLSLNCCIWIQTIFNSTKDMVYRKFPVDVKP